MGLIVTLQPGMGYIQVIGQLAIDPLKGMTQADLTDAEDEAENDVMTFYAKLGYPTNQAPGCWWWPAAEGGTCPKSVAITCDHMASAIALHKWFGRDNDNKDGMVQSQILRRDANRRLHDSARNGVLGDDGVIIRLPIVLAAQGVPKVMNHGGSFWGIGAMGLGRFPRE